MQCFQCGEEQPNEDIFCTKCGSRLSRSQPSASPREDPRETLAVSGSATEEEDKILRELKEALGGVDPDPNPNTASAGKPRWNAGKTISLAGGILGLILVAIIVFKLLPKKRGEPALPPATAVETAPKPVVEPAPVSDDSVRTTVGKMASMLEAIEQYTKNKKGLPPSLTNLNRSYADPETLKDGWGQSILYLVDLTNKTFILQSVGPDGKRATADDISVDGETRESWLKEREPAINEWRISNADLQAQLLSIGPSPEELKKLEATRIIEEEKKKKVEAARAASTLAQKQEQERKRLEATRLEEDKRKQDEAKKREEEQRRAKAREEALRQQQAARTPEGVKESFIDGLALWDAPATWEIIKDKDVSALRVQGLGFLKKGEQWDNYKVEFEVKVNKESAGWVLRAQNSSNFYLFKLASEKARAVPKNSLVKYIRSDDKYLNSLKQEDAPGAAGVTPLSSKVRNKDYYKVTVTVRGNTITHYIDGIQVDTWTDDTFTHGRFGFNASAIEQATIRSVSIQPLR